MAKQLEGPDRADTADLVGEIIGHAERLLGQQVRLLKSELRHEAQKAGSAALALGAGAGLLAAGGGLSTLMAVHLLRRVTGLPLWACYGLTAGALGAAGVRLLASGSKQARRLELPALPESAAALKENVTWLKDQLTTNPA